MLDLLDPDQLRETLIRARDAALTANRGGADDGGTCNFDSAVMHVPKADVPIVRAAAEGIGVRVAVGDWLCGSEQAAVFLSADGARGQADANTRAARALCDVLKEAGLPAMMFYQMD